MRHVEGSSVAGLGSERFVGGLGPRRMAIVFCIVRCGMVKGGGRYLRSRSSCPVEEGNDRFWTDIATCAHGNDRLF